MFKDIGGKIKTYVEVVVWIGILFFVGLGIYCVILGVMNESVGSIFAGVLVAVIGSLFSWLMGLFTYGFGQLIQNTDILVSVLAPNHIQQKENVQYISKEESDRINKAYLDSDWKASIQYLSDEELMQRMNSEDWQMEYRVLCKNEFERRNNK